MKKKTIIHNRTFLKQLRRDLRNNGTSAEAFLWRYLKRRQLHGRRFNRQHSIENFIVDFYCAKEKLIIELDGQVHFNAAAQEYDYYRTERLIELGFRVVRFENKLVFENLIWVLQEIERHFELPQPLL